MTCQSDHEIIERLFLAFNSFRAPDSSWYETSTHSWRLTRTRISGKEKQSSHRIIFFLLRFVIFGLISGPSQSSPMNMILTGKPICGAAIPLPKACLDRKSSSVSRKFLIAARVDADEQSLMILHFERSTGLPRSNIFFTAIVLQSLF